MKTNATSEIKQHPIIFSIAGSDSSGGAGIQADIKTISALGGYAATAITSVTAQNTCGVQAIFPLPDSIVTQQIHSVMKDLQPNAIKIGMIGEDYLVHCIVKKLYPDRRIPVVYDPVMVSSSGRKLLSDKAIKNIQQYLFPLTTLITPNLDEVRTLLQCEIHTPEDMFKAAKILSESFHTSVLVKGGHLKGNEMCDVLYTEKGNSHIFKEIKIHSKNLHGTGCTLSSAIATYLGMGDNMYEAIGKAKNYISKAIRAGKEMHIGSGNGPLWHFPEQIAQK